MVEALLQRPVMRHERRILVTIAISVFAPYFLINRITAAWPARDLSTFVDRWVGFQPAWELVYASIYVYMFIPVVYLREPQLFRRAVLGFCLIQLSCFVIFLVWPVGIDRPSPADPQHQFLHWGVTLNYALDQPRNLFPSLHLANAFMVSLLLCRVDRRVGLPALIWAGLIGYSTLAVKHHFFLDVVAGISLALIVDRYLFAPACRNLNSGSACYPRTYLLGLMLLYPGAVLLLYLLWRAGWQPVS